MGCAKASRREGSTISFVTGVCKPEILPSTGAVGLGMERLFASVGEFGMVGFWSGFRRSNWTVPLPEGDLPDVPAWEEAEIGGEGGCCEVVVDFSSSRVGSCSVTEAVDAEAMSTSSLAITEPSSCSCPRQLAPLKTDRQTAFAGSTVKGVSVEATEGGGLCRFAEVVDEDMDGVL
jgi:hypothetical protein